MREIDVSVIKETVAKLCIEANMRLPESLFRRIKDCSENENTDLSRSIMNDITENLDAAREMGIPICQDTGMAVVFLNIGQDVHFTGGSLYDAVNMGVAEGYNKGFLRKSIVGDPLRRVNTGDNTPAVIHTSITDGDKITVTVAPKGFGSENMSAVKMLKPSDGREGVFGAVVTAVKNAGSNPCPPIVVGVGIGGDFEQCAYLSKKALCRDVNVKNPDPYYAKMEDELLKLINELSIGPQGFGGNTTALAVNIETAPTHIAGLPVAINIGCHVTRHSTITI